NIHEAVKLAMHRAITQLEPMPEHILIDAVNIDDLPCSSEVIKKGDANSISIAAASILAKVTRDQIMKDLHKTYPLYDFDSNNGYGTKHHVNMPQQYGPTPYHRKSFAPVRHALLTKEVSFDGGFSNNCKSADQLACSSQFSAPRPGRQRACAKIISPSTG